MNALARGTWQNRRVGRARVAWSAVPLAVACLVVAACGDEVTETLVHFELDEKFGERAFGLRVEVWDQDDAHVYDELRTALTSPALRFPATVPIVAADPRRPGFRFAGTLQDAGGRMLVTEGAIASHVVGEVRELFVCLDTRCEGVMCPDTERCVLGACVAAEMEPMPLGASDARDRCGAVCVGDADCACASDRCVDGACVPAQPAVVIAAGDRHSCAVTDSGALWCWGANDTGQLGAGDTVARDIPVRVLDGVIDVGLGDAHTCAGTDVGMQCWGQVLYGQLGISPVEAPSVIPSPMVVVDWYPTDGGWTIVAAGARHSCAIRAPGELRCTGDNAQLQLGIPQEWDGATFPSSVGEDGEWADIAAGPEHSCAIHASDRSLYCWGANGDGRLAEGDPPLTSPVKLPRQASDTAPLRLLSLGASHGCAVRADSGLVCWGANDSSQLGLGAGAPTAVRTLTQVGDRLEWTAVTAGGDHSCGVLTPATGAPELQCWGSNGYGELGLGDIMPRVEPARVGLADPVSVAAGSHHTCAIDVRGAVWCWGGGSDGQLGTGERADRVTPARVCVGE